MASSRQRFSDGEFAVGHVLFRGENLARHGREIRRQVRRDGIEVSDPQFRCETQHAGMGDAGVRRDDTGAFDLAFEPGRAKELAA